MLVLRVRERTFLMTEQLAVYRPLGYRTAVYCEVRTVLARGESMDDLREMLFSYTRLSGHQHAQIRAGHLNRNFYPSVQQRTGADNAEPLFNCQ